MAFHIAWSDTAYEDLREIVQYIALDDPEAASNLADRVIYHIELASDFPFANRIVPEKDDKSIREAILSPYRIIYSVDSIQTSIHILRIWHSSRGIPELGG
jgi:toxin ParE1/3/4